MTNDTQTLALTEFLLARIAETADWAEHPLFPEVVRKHLVAECGAKRRLVAWHGATHVCEDNMVFAEDEPQWDEANPSPRPPCGVMTILATVYADHPDYDQAWRP